MKNIRLSGKNILNFLQNHYDFVKSVFHHSKPEFIVASDVFDKFIADYNEQNEAHISVSKLIQVKFCRQLPTGDYKINIHYTNFLQFVFDDFTLDLPDTLKNRYQTIFQLFIDLKAESNELKINALIQNIISVIEKFLYDIHRQTQRLLSDTEALKANVEEYTNLTKRLEKAVFWIDEYIEPLNRILEKEHPQSFYYELTRIQAYASEKRYTAKHAQQRIYEKLYASAVNARNELDQNLQYLTRELKPLLDRIKQDSIILTGFYHLVEDIDNINKYGALPNLIKKSRDNVMFKGFQDNANYFIDQFDYKTAEAYYQETEDTMHETLPDSLYFKEQLIKSNQVTDFYEWCFKILSEHTDNIKLHDFFKVTNLLLEEDIIAEYNLNERKTVELQDAIVEIPIISVYEVSK